MLATEKTLDDFCAVTYPRDRLVLEFVKMDKDIGCITIAFPSWHAPDRKSLCHYFFDDSKRDFCLCDGALKYGKRCWHLAWRPIIVKAFLNRKLDDDTGWLTNIELYGAHTVEKIAQFIADMLDFQEEISQVDLLDLELRDHNGEPVDRRRIGPAFQTLRDEGIIEPVREVVAQYARRKGGKVYVWKRVRK